MLTGLSVEGAEQLVGTTGYTTGPDLRYGLAKMNLRALTTKLTNRGQRTVPPGFVGIAKVRWPDGKGHWVIIDRCDPKGPTTIHDPSLPDAVWVGQWMGSYFGKAKLTSYMIVRDDRCVPTIRDSATKTGSTLVGTRSVSAPSSKQTNQ
jgi:hypothetical protein